MTNKTLARIIREADTVDLIEVLAERLPPTDLQTLLLAVYRQRAERLQPCDVLQQYSQNRFVRPSPALPQTLLEFDQLAFSHLPAGYEPVELSPVARWAAAPSSAASAANAFTPFLGTSK